MSARRIGSTTSIDGKKFGGSYDVPAYGPLSYTRPGVPQGRISEKLVHTSKLYGGMQSNYWIYVPAQYDPAVPAALMVWQDGERYITRNVEEQCRLCPSLYRLHEVTDNLIHDKKIPVMIHVFVSPGTHRRQEHSRCAVRHDVGQILPVPA